MFVGVTTTTRRPTFAPRGKIIKQASSGRCLDIDQNDLLIFSSKCQTRFEVCFSSNYLKLLLFGKKLLWKIIMPEVFTYGGRVVNQAKIKNL